MLIINGHKFAKNDKEAMDTLFQKGGTFFGFYKKLKGRIIFKDMQGKVFAALVVNSHDFADFVNAIELNGRIHYQYAASEKNEKIFGVPDKFSERGGYARSVFAGV